MKSPLSWRCTPCWAVRDPTSEYHWSIRARRSFLSAAFINCASANVSDLDDTHFPTITHPTLQSHRRCWFYPNIDRLRERRCCWHSRLASMSHVALGTAFHRVTIGKAGTLRPPAVCLARPWQAPRYSISMSDVSYRRLAWRPPNSSGLVECLGTDAKSVSIGFRA
jgi:hypothetical protein